VTFTVPGDAPPGTLLSIPVRGGSEVIKVRVPDDVGTGSTLVLTQAEGSEEWSLQLGSVVYDVGGARQFGQEGRAKLSTDGALASPCGSARSARLLPAQAMMASFPPRLAGLESGHRD